MPVESGKRLIQQKQLRVADQNARQSYTLLLTAGELAWERMQAGDGNSTYRNRIIDALFNMTGDELEKGAKYEIR